MRCGLPDERRTASTAERISSAACGSRIFCNLLGQKSDVDSRPQRGGREFLDEDRISRAGYAARKYHAGRCEGRESENGSNRANACPFFPDLARWQFKDSR